MIPEWLKITLAIVNVCQSLFMVIFAINSLLREHRKGYKWTWISWCAIGVIWLLLYASEFTETNISL